MPARDYEMLQRFWMHEPWGAYRDNVHAAIIAAEIRRPNLKKGARVKLDDFMLRHPADVEEQQARDRNTATRNLFQFLKAIATKRPRPKNG